MRGRYIGESSRLAHQRGKEHMRNIKDGLMGNPIFQHFWEENQATGGNHESGIKALKGIEETGGRVCTHTETKQDPKGLPQ